MKKNILLIVSLLITLTSYSQVSENVELLYHWNDTTTIELNYRDSRYSDVWGFEFEDREYAVLGSTYGTHVFDVTDPNSAYEVDRKPGAVQGYSVNHRDFKVYDHYLYGVCDEGASSLQIFDFNYLPDSIHKVFDDTTYFNRSHTIFIDVNEGILYACGNNNHALSIFSLENPEEPALITHFDEVPYVHDMYARNNIAYLNCGAGLYVVNFSNPLNPIFLGTLTDYPDQGYNHSGWLNEAGDTYVFCDETYGSPVKICDVSNLADIQIIATVTSGVSDNSIAHNAFIKGDSLYIAYYNDGLQVFDISDPETPFRVGYYDTFLPNQDDDYRGAWGVYPFLPSGNILIGDRNSGLYVVRMTESVNIDERDILENLVSVYPNPFQSSIVVNLDLESTNDVNFLLFNSQGQEIKKWSESNVPTGSRSITLKLENLQLKEDFYYLKVFLGNEQHVFKLLENKH